MRGKALEVNCKSLFSVMDSLSQSKSEGSHTDHWLIQGVHASSRKLTRTREVFEGVASITGVAKSYNLGADELAFKRGKDD